MFNAENVQIGPNILARSAEEDEDDNKQRVGTLKDKTNCRGRRARGSTTMEGSREDAERIQAESSKKVQVQEKQGMEKENLPVRGAKLANLIIDFDSKEQFSEEDEKQMDKNSKEVSQTASEKGDVPKRNEDQLLSIPKKNAFLLMLNSEEQISQQADQSDPQTATKNTDFPGETAHQPIQKYTKQKFLLDLQAGQEEEQSERHSHSSDSPAPQLPAVIYKKVIRLNDLVGILHESYYSQPIPQGAVFQCVMKRDRSDSNIRYHLYDNLSLRNFMTILKDDDGYLIIAKEEGYLCGRTGEGRDVVVGRMTSNFFGTEFNCLLDESPYKRGRDYPVNSKAQRTITIEYETNLFGLKGPRKLAAFIPKIGQCGYPKSLNEVYQKTGGRQVLKFKNKTPKWSKEVGAYVLNFGGRATVSSIKNFIMVQDGQEERGSDRVLFGKFGKELFNLDVRYPFSVLQALSLALSSFDRKLACE